MRCAVWEDLLVSAAFLFLALPLFDETNGAWTGLSSLLLGPSILSGLNLFLVQLESRSGSSSCVGTAPNRKGCGGRSLGVMSDADPIIDWVRCRREGLLKGLCWTEDLCRDVLSSRPRGR